MKKNYKLLVVDDEVMLTDLLAQHFQALGYLVYTANSGKDALAQIAVQPDLILLDINMTDMDGIEFCQSVRAHISCPILFLTARITEQDKIRGLQVGGDDYITKPFSLEELSARVEAHLRREERGHERAEIMTSKELLVNFSEGAVYYEGEVIPFSKREFELIQYLISHPGYVYDKEHIYEAVWGMDAEGDSKTVKEHIRKIRQKLQAVTGKEYIETVWGMGYRWIK